MISIKYQPSTSTFARLLQLISPVGLMVLWGLIMISVHWMAINVFRKRQSETRFSWVLILGSILFPFLFLLSYSFAHIFIDWAIGLHASQYHGYPILMVLYYPLLLPIYWIIMWQVDRSITKKYRT